MLIRSIFDVVGRNSHFLSIFQGFEYAGSVLSLRGLTFEFNLKSAVLFVKLDHVRCFVWLAVLCSRSHKVNVNAVAERRQKLARGGLESKGARLGFRGILRLYQFL